MLELVLLTNNSALALLCMVMSCVHTVQHNLQYARVQYACVQYNVHYVRVQHNVQYASVQYNVKCAIVHSAVLLSVHIKMYIIWLYGEK